MCWRGCVIKRIDIIVPCYNEQDCIPLLYNKINEVFSAFNECSFSIIFINDGSSDASEKVILDLAEKHGREKVKYIFLSRNFGKESAIFAGLSMSTGDYVVLMDADLQHPPELIPKMYDKIIEGYDCCGAKRVDRKGEPVVRSFFSRLFYKIMNNLTGLQFVQGGSDFRMMTAQVARTMVSLKERERFTKGIFSWVGFNSCWIEYENTKRVAGKTKWSFFGLMRYAINGMMSFVATPLRAAIYFGFFIDLVTLIFGIYFFISALNPDAERTGYATIILLIMFFGGTTILILGVIGEYLARIFIEIKQRPIFLLKDTNIKKISEDLDE